MNNYPNLDKVVVAMTVADRKNKNKPMAGKWVSRGFKKINKPTLIKYWEKRLEANTKDVELYNRILASYEKTLPGHKKTSPASPTVEAPGVWQMMKTAAVAGKNFVKSGMHFVSEEQFNLRETICKGCEYWNPKGYGNTGQCLQCGCATKAKLKMASESCPLKKWVKIEVNTQEHQ